MVFQPVSRVLYIHVPNKTEMKSPKRKELFEKYIKRECSKEELQQVVAYFRNSKDLEDVPTVGSVSRLLANYPDMEEKTADIMFKNIVVKNSERKNNYRFRKIAALAAVFVGLLTMGYFYQQTYFTPTGNEILLPANEAVTLQLDNGNIKVITEKGNRKIVDAHGNIVSRQQGKLLIYDKDTDPEKLIFNTLTVPYGKKFEVQLSDGSIAYLNAGSSLKYPINFIPEKDRQVFLKGEAFFSVAKDSLHPFIVHTDALNIKVLGTEFNVSNYPEDSRINVVLVEGAVAMYGNGNLTDKKDSTILVPSTKGSFDKKSGAIVTEKVVTSTYTSWRNGQLVFRNMSFDNILKKMERHYNVKIINTNEKLGKTEFNAGFNNENINEFLQALETAYGIEYSIEDNTVIIK